MLPEAWCCIQRAAPAKRVGWAAGRKKRARAAVSICSLCALSNFFFLGSSPLEKAALRHA